MTQDVNVPTENGRHSAKRRKMDHIGGEAADAGDHEETVEARTPSHVPRNASAEAIRSHATCSVSTVPACKRLKTKHCGAISESVHYLHDASIDTCRGSEAGDGSVTALSNAAASSVHGETDAAHAVAPPPGGGDPKRRRINGWRTPRPCCSP